MKASKVVALVKTPATDISDYVADKLRFVIHELQLAEHTALIAQTALQDIDPSAAAVLRRHVGDALHTQLDELEALIGG